VDPATGLLYTALLKTAETKPAARLAVLHAVDDVRLLPLVRAQRLDLLQTFRPDAEAMRKSGMSTVEALQGSYGAIAIRPSKNKVQTLGWVAEALAHLEADGVLLLAAENSHGARSYERLLAAIGPVASASKAKCRLIRLRKTADMNRQLLVDWRQAAEPGLQPAHGLWSAPGLFSWEKPDAGSVLLLQHLPERLEGTGMDLCCGYGFLGETLLQRHPEIAALHMLDADRLALAMAGRNTEADGEKGSGKVKLHWLDAARESLPKGLDWIACNPPFHTGQARDVELGQAIVTHACDALRTGGRIWLVANRKLPYEKRLESRLREVRVLTQEQGYKILEGVR